MITYHTTDDRGALVGFRIHATGKGTATITNEFSRTLGCIRRVTVDVGRRPVRRWEIEPWERSAVTLDTRRTFRTRVAAAEYLAGHFVAGVAS